MMRLIGKMSSASGSSWSWLPTTLVLCAIYISITQGACTFKKSWTGRWFQSGVPMPLYINESYIDTKGECYEEQGDKYIVHDKAEDCYRCMAIHEKHNSVLQYKETYCDMKSSLQELCFSMTGDAALYSMFRKYPETKPVPCPFKSAPFTFAYNRGSGDCSNPPSKAESCTDDSRLVLKYQACPDIASTESNVEELTCLANWKEGSTRYLVGRVSQGGRRNLNSDEDQFRCFIYQRDKKDNKTVYNIAQSGDATCNGLQSAFEGSRTMKLTTVDNYHNRCKFPKWITDHHTWLSLDDKKIYKFTQKNATLKIIDEEPFQIRPKKNNYHQNFAHQPFGFQEFGFESQDQKRQSPEMKMICHGILEAKEQKMVQIVAHITSGCDSGYVCMIFYKRDSNVIEIQQSENMVENPDEACANFNPSTASFTTLITTSLHPKKCPSIGQYMLMNNEDEIRRKKRQQPQNMEIQPPPECVSSAYDSLAVGCTNSQKMEFSCLTMTTATSAYSCHGSWTENGVHYVIASAVSRKSKEALRYCFVYTKEQMQPVIEGAMDKKQTQMVLRISSASDSCHRHIIPGITGKWSFNFTSNGACGETDFSSSSSQLVLPIMLIILPTILAIVVIR